MANPSTPSPFRSGVPPTAPAPRRPPDFRAAQEHHKAGRLIEAEAGYRNWLGLHPGDVAALHMLGLVNHQAGRQHEALALLRQAVRAAGNAVSPAKAAEYRSNLAAVLGRVGQHAEAAAQLAEVVRVRPDYAQGHCNLGVALELSGRKEEAAAAYRRAIALKADYAQAFNALGNCLRKLQRVDEAESAYRQAVRLKPGHAGAYANLAIVLSGQGRLAEVIECRRKVAELRPGSAAAGSALLSTLHYDAASTPEMLLEMAREWAGRHAARSGEVGGRELGVGSTRTAEVGSGERRVGGGGENVSPSSSRTPLTPGDQTPQIPTPHIPTPHVPTPHIPTPHAPTPHAPTPQKRLRVGFVSSNLSGHPEGRFLRPLLANLDREAFETTCYSAGPRADAVTALLRQLCDRWRDIRRMSDEQVAAGIRQDGIDILVDLTGHFGGNRLGIFAREPAPVQVIHFGYPGTSGMAAMDWRVTDEYADPDRGAGKHENRNSKSEINLQSEEKGGMTETRSVGEHENRNGGSAEETTGAAGEACCAPFVHSNFSSPLNLLRASDFGFRASDGATEDKPGAQRSGAPDGCCERRELSDEHRDAGGSGAPLRCARGLSDVAVTTDETGRGGNGSSIEKTPALPSPGVPREGKCGPLSNHYTTENLLRLPGLAWVYDEPLEARAVGASPAKRNGHMTFLCANNPLKVTPRAVAAWAKILGAVPDSRLTMLLDEKGPQSARKEKPSEPRPAGNGEAAPGRPVALPPRPEDAAAGRWLREAFAGRGIDPARIGFAGRQSRGAYFAWIASADIALDPFPYNGGVTTCDTLWMGVPVVSLAGNTYWSRQGLALLSNVGHPELAASTAEQYVQTAVALATDLPRLAEIRHGLRRRMRRSGIVDAAGFARKMEAGYRRMWEQRAI